MKNFKKILTLFLLAIFAFNVIGYFLFFGISEIRVKKEIAETISAGNLFSKTEIIAFPINAFNDQEQDEIWYNNKLYDILKKETKNDSIFFYVLNDQKEERLISKLGTHLEQDGTIIFHANNSKHPVKGCPADP